jgi:hypothetical protein
MTTRSQVLARHLSTDASWVAGFVPPPGWCWIVKTISISSDSNTAGEVRVRAGQTIGTSYVDVVRQQLAAQAVLELQTWVMVMDTDQLAFLSPAASVGFWISGTELPMPPADQSVTSPL